MRLHVLLVECCMAEQLNWIHLYRVVSLCLRIVHALGYLSVKAFVDVVRLVNLCCLAR